ncbi:hypothetical protein PALA111701_05895 [Paenibacillus lactis]
MLPTFHFVNGKPYESRRMNACYHQSLDLPLVVPKNLTKIRIFNESASRK